MKRVAILAVCLAALGRPAGADDGGIAFGGTPRLLSGHPTVAMESEVVTMTVGERAATVDCRFVFRNDGPACTVRMGFPDAGDGSADPDEEHAADYLKYPPKALFTSFRSWVDGQAAPTQLIRSNEPGHFWHAKTVRFPAHSRVRVRDLYTVPLGGGVVGTTNNQVIFGAETMYVLHTGASWHGPIGRAEVIVRFDRKGLKGPLVLRQGDVTKPFRAQPSAVYWKGPCRPTVDGTTLRFVRSSFRPTEKDDIYLCFAGPDAREGR